MPANFTRRRDFFLDAGFDNPDAVIELVAKDADTLGLTVGTGDGTALAFEECIERATLNATTLLSDATQHLLDQSIEWLFERGGDLTTLLWLARALNQESEDIHYGAFIFGLAAKMWQHDLKKEAAAMLRFFVEMDFDYGDLYNESNIAYGFFQSREPNPLVWKLLNYVNTRGENVEDAGLEQLHILELGCGIGNDALGLLSSPRAHGYVGVDISPRALQGHQERVKPLLKNRPEIHHRLLEADFVQALKERIPGDLKQTNLIYSYSSLHYFSSEEVREIFGLVREVLEPGRGLFCFAIKGKGSIWDGQGVPLYKPDVWINYDGQSRWFPSRTSLAAMIDRYGFEMRLHEWHEHWGYSEYGELDLFHYVICSPRA